MPPQVPDRLCGQVACTSLGDFGNVLAREGALCGTCAQVRRRGSTCVRLAQVPIDGQDGLNWGKGVGVTEACQTADREEQVMGTTTISPPSRLLHAQQTSCFAFGIGAAAVGAACSDHENARCIASHQCAHTPIPANDLRPWHRSSRGSRHSHIAAGAMTTAPAAEVLCARAGLLRVGHCRGWRRLRR